MKKILLLGMLLCGLSDVWGTFTAGGAALSTSNVTFAADGLNTVAVIAGNVVASGITIGADALLNEINALDDENTATTVQINGNFTIVSSDVTSANLDEITSITGDVEIYGNTVLTSLSMASLGTIGGDVWIGGYSLGDNEPNTVMATCTLTALTTVTGYFYVTENPRLTSLVVDNLATVGGYVWISDNSLMTGFSADSLTTVGAYVRIQDNPLMETCTLTDLTTVGTSLWIKVCNALTSISLNNIEIINSDLFLDKNPLLTTVSMTSLVTVTGDFYFDQDPSLTTVSMEALTTITGDFFFYDNNTITVNGTFTSLNSIFGQAWEYGTLGVFSKTVDDAKEVRIYSFGVTSFNAADLGNYTVGGVISGTFFIMPSDTLTTIDSHAFDALTSIGGSFWVGGHSHLQALSMDFLTNVGGYVWISDNIELKTFSTKRLTSIGSYFYAINNPTFTTLLIDGVVTVAEYLALLNMPLLTMVPLNLFDGVVGNVKCLWTDYSAGTTGLVDVLPFGADRTALGTDNGIISSVAAAIIKRHPQVTVNVAGVPRTLHTHINTNYHNGGGTYVQKKHSLLGRAIAL